MTVYTAPVLANVPQSPFLLAPRYVAPSVEAPLSMESSPVSWQELWTKLTAAQIRFRKAVWSDGRCIVVFRRTPASARQFPLTAREKTVLVRTLQGERQKLIAFEGRIAPSTVANSLKSARTKLGFEDRLDAAPLATLVVAHGTDNASSAPQRDVHSIGNGEWYLASSPRPDWSRYGQVTKAERLIAHAIIEGRSNTEIARERDTSVHTVENQVASLFRKVDASGRFDLIRVLYQPHDASREAERMSA